MSDASAPPPPPSPPPSAPATPFAPRRVGEVRPWHAVVAFFVGGFLAQLLGGVVFVVAAIVVAVRRGGDLGDLQSGASSFAVVAPSALTVGLVLLVISLLVPWIASAPIRPALALSRPGVVATLACLLGTAGCAPLAQLLVETMKRVAPGLTFGTLEQLDALVRGTPAWALWPVLALSPGICEELFFRGLIQRAFRGAATAVIVSGVSFAVFHLDPHHVVGVLPIGLYLAWVAQRTGSTWVTVVAHVANNTASIAAAKLQSPADLAAEEPTPWWAALVGLALVAVSCAIVHRFGRARAVPVSEAGG